ncbi:MAG: hypothetical protein Q9163_001831 [Psora crenata]
MSSSRQAWELENAVKIVDPTRDALYTYDANEQRELTEAKPWKKDPYHFKHVRISAVALLKMVMHARSGGSIEVMGLMQGKISGDTFIVTDAFRLPVEGTETRVNAANEANEYLIQYLQSCRDNGRLENAVGWYHSHPGYGCWLSGIDVSTQNLQQSFQDPFLAVVIDPDRTISAGRVEIGAFRTFPESYKADNRNSDDGYQSIPLNKIEDFGAHASRYYSLEISNFKSTLDTHLLELLWNKYWVTTLTQSPLFTNREYANRQMLDLSEKIKNVEKGAAILRGGQHRMSASKDGQFEKVIQGSNNIAREERTGVLASEVKVKLFNGVGSAPAS